MSQPRPRGWMGMCERCCGWAWHASSVPLWAEKGHESKNPPGGPGEPDTCRHQAQKGTGQEDHAHTLALPLELLGFPV